MSPCRTSASCRFDVLQSTVSNYTEILSILSRLSISYGAMSKSYRFHFTFIDVVSNYIEIVSVRPILYRYRIELYRNIVDYISRFISRSDGLGLSFIDTEVYRNIIDYFSFNRYRIELDFRSISVTTTVLRAHHDCCRPYPSFRIVHRGGVIKVRQLPYQVRDNDGLQREELLAQHVEHSLLLRGTVAGV